MLPIDFLRASIGLWTILLPSHPTWSAPSMLPRNLAGCRSTYRRWRGKVVSRKSALFPAPAGVKARMGSTETRSMNGWRTEFRSSRQVVVSKGRAMTRKIKLHKTKVDVLVNGKTITVSLYPPQPPQTSWYAYWRGLKAHKSTGQSDLDAARRTVQDMLRNGGRPSQLSDAMLSNAEFEEIQRRHFGKKKDLAAKARAAKSLA